MKLGINFYALAIPKEVYPENEELPKKKPPEDAVLKTIQERFFLKWAI